MMNLLNHPIFRNKIETDRARRARRFSDVPDDGRHGPYRSKYVCFDCRKVWRPRGLYWLARMSKCPQCAKILWDGGPMLKVPRRGKIKAWCKLEAAISEVR